MAPQRPPNHQNQRFQYNGNTNIHPRFPAPSGPRGPIPMSIPRRPPSPVPSPWNIAPSWPSPGNSSPVPRNPDHFRRQPNINPWLPAPRPQSRPDLFLFSQSEYHVPIPQLRWESLNNGPRPCSAYTETWRQLPSPRSQLPVRCVSPTRFASPAQQSRDFTPEAQHQLQCRSSSSANSQTQPSIPIPMVRRPKFKKKNTNCFLKNAKECVKRLIPWINSSTQLSQGISRSKQLSLFTPRGQAPGHAILRYPSDVHIDELRPTPPLLYHYTNLAGKDAILKNGYLRVPKQDFCILNLNETSPNARYGRGIYFTNIKPERPTFEILRNNYGVTTNTRFDDRVKYCFEFKSDKINGLIGPSVRTYYKNRKRVERLIWKTEVHKFFLNKGSTKLINSGTYYERIDETGENSDRKQPKQVIPHRWEFAYNPSEGEE